MNDPVAQEWERCRHYIEAALENSPRLESIEYVERMLGDGLYMLWTGPNCALITRIAIYPNKKIFEVMHGGGDKREIIQRLGPMMEKFAAEQGCDEMAVIGREGWKREGLKHGWRFGYVAMFKSLKH